MSPRIVIASPCAVEVTTAPGKRRAGFPGLISSLLHDEGQQEHGDHQADPDRGFIRQAQPLGEVLAQAHKGQVDIGRAEQADEEAVAACGGHGQEPAALDGGRAEFPHRHADQHQHDADEEDRHRRGPGHPVQQCHTRPMAKPLAM